MANSVASGYPHVKHLAFYSRSVNNAALNTCRLAVDYKSSRPIKSHNKTKLAPDCRPKT